MPSRELSGIVVVGFMNPAIHHPSWYQTIQLIDKQEYDAAVSGPILLTPQITQFAARDFNIVCTADRWEIQTQRLEAMDRILTVASRIFEVLDHTPVSAYGFNFHFHRDTAVQDVGRLLGSAIEKLPLGLNLSGDIAGQLTLVSTERGHKITTNVAQSQLGANVVFVSLNFHYDILRTETPSYFQLSPMLKEHFSSDQSHSQAYAQTVVEGLVRMEGRMAVAIRESPTEIEERLMAEERFPDAALLSKRLGISSDALIRELVSARSAARLMAYEREKGTTLPTREASGIFIVPRVELVFRRDEEEFETAYDRLGVWAGPYSSRSAIKSELDFWRASGAQGASWLVQRIRNESGNETLNAVANILSNVDTTSLSVVLGTLQAARRRNKHIVCSRRSVEWGRKVKRSTRPT